MRYYTGKDLHYTHANSYGTIRSYGPLFFICEKEKHPYSYCLQTQSQKIKIHRAVPPPWSSSLLGGSTHNIPIVLRMTSAAGLTSLRADATPLRTTTNGIHKNPSSKDHALNFISSD